MSDKYLLNTLNVSTTTKTEYVGHGGYVVQGRWTNDREVAGLNPIGAPWKLKLWQFPLLHFGSVLRKRH